MTEGLYRYATEKEIDQLLTEGWSIVAGRLWLGDWKSYLVFKPFQSATLWPVKDYLRECDFLVDRGNY